MDKGPPSVLTQGQLVRIRHPGQGRFGGLAGKPFLELPDIPGLVGFLVFRGIDLGTARERTIGRGIEKISWPRPVRPGDALSYEGEIIEIRPSEKNPKRGTIRVKNTTRNQKGEVVMEMESLVLIPRRG